MINDLRCDCEDIPHYLTDLKTVMFACCWSLQRSNYSTLTTHSPDDLAGRTCLLLGSRDWIKFAIVRCEVQYALRYLFREFYKGLVPSGEVVDNRQLW